MVFRIMLQFEARYNSARTAQEFTHNLLLCEILKAEYNSKKSSPGSSIIRIKSCFMADIKISYITPRHFYETVRLLRTVPHNFRFSAYSVTIEFDRTFTLDFEKLEYLSEFLRELKNSSVPVELDEFIKTYKKSPGKKFHRRY